MPGLCGTKREKHKCQTLVNKVVHKKWWSVHTGPNKFSNQECHAWEDNAFALSVNCRDLISIPTNAYKL